ncbi:TRAP transporter small permease [Mesorhizobium sp. YIM 152430]|uniref:TRAP transporter small permease subunit n=1 Tax=Mesorhizobium sp. YIM 152430 TaxID=3031761 RepID=UPI0023DC6277|nr:TRAP transporter small permease [Mesorhizobium sp. YIM 152430]MDF1598939.1 TRAP transporter small permease [Mesorhizobium sp. YIM 152430]
MSGQRSLAGLAMHIADLVKTLNRWIALICGLVLMITVVLILCEVLGRRIAFFRVGGADEIAGYVMAGIATWGFSYALVERAHVRIDIVHAKLPAPGRALLDVIALASVLCVALLVAYYAYDVLTKSVERGSRSNTPMAIQLWIPQVIWFAGWAWMAVTATIMLICTVILALARQWSLVTNLTGIPSETGEVA